MQLYYLQTSQKEVEADPHGCILLEASNEQCSIILGDKIGVLHPRTLNSADKSTRGGPFFSRNTVEKLKYSSLPTRNSGP